MTNEYILNTALRQSAVDLSCAKRGTERFPPRVG